MARHPLRIAVSDIHDDGLDVIVDPALPDITKLLAALNERRRDDDGFVGSLTASFQLERWPKRIDVHGKVDAVIGQICARCLESYAQPVHREVEQILMQGPQSVEGEEIELTLSDLDRSELVDDQVDLLAIIEEEVRLDLPAKPLCREDCKGICPGCGAELNNEPCRCEPEVDPRWGALAGLKLKS